MNKNKIGVIIAVLVIVTYVAIFGQQLTAWSGFPKGADAYARITRIIYNGQFFPHVFWQYHWANGMPNYKSEAPLFYFLGTFIAKVFSLTPEKPLYIIGFLTFVMIGVGLFGYVYEKTKSHLGALLTSVIALSSFSLWFWMVAGGIYPRIFAVGLSMITLWRAAVFLNQLRTASVFPKKAFAWLVLPLALTMMSHVLMSFFLCGTLFFIFLAEPISKRQRIKYGLMIFLTSFGLAAFFFLPMFVGFSSGSARFIGVISPVIPALKYYLYDFAGMGPFLVPLFFLSSILYFFLKSKGQKEEISLVRSILPSLLMLIFFSTYAFIGYTGLSGRYYYINGFIPLSATLFISIYGSIIIGLTFARLIKINRLIFSSLAVVFILGIPVLTSVVGVPLIKADERILNIVNYGEKSDKNPVYSLQQSLKFPKEEYNYRFAPSDAMEAVWFNALYTIPQVRDYYGQGILYPDWRYWFEQAVWDETKFSIDEARAAFDWFAVKWFTTYESNPGMAVLEIKGDNEESRRSGAITVEEVLASSQIRYFHEPGFNFVGYGRIFYDGLQEEFEIEKPSPILSAVNTPTTLFIGKKENYNLLFSNLTFGNYSSQKLIPLRGKEYVDAYSLAELTKFPSIYLYGFKYKNFTKADKLISDYMENGGTIFWESIGSPEALKSDKKTAIFKVFPFTGVKEAEVGGGDWKITVNEPDALTEGLNFSAFSPPLYNGTPWKIITADKTQIRSGAKVLFSSGDYPLMVAVRYGKGKLIWTGFNYLYHINANKNMEEVKLLYRLYDSVGSSDVKKPIYVGKFVNPEKREVAIKDKASGVLFKESYYPNWKAYWLSTKGEKVNLPIILAGPGMSYVSLGEEITFPGKVVFEYHFSLAEKLGVFLSVFSIVVLIFYLVKPEMLSKIGTTYNNKKGLHTKKTFNWLNDEEN